MQHDLRRRKRGTRGIGFPGFVADHMKRLEGEKVEISSLQQIRKLEKEHQDQSLCFEAFSYDHQYGSDSPTGPEENPIPYDPHREIPPEFLIDSEIE